MTMLLPAQPRPFRHCRFGFPHPIMTLNQTKGFEKSSASPTALDLVFALGVVSVMLKTMTICSHPVRNKKNKVRIESVIG